ncbi:hypothetical protein EPUS_08246 [Endocarpon pusillum Z07020]|uniref:Uncharacterized protein n=1 Tax=Endocarpon pusillum (strain Z07020 / HMAS-L-300199) TaxID=1263415 RepID=U1GEE4_ENDPU|nr:uncharacterized protein EPUS_08246 [Endocarpon pusillum Z07020]ERF75992.1 hypothetical protein EPUS_08246 [Endocarpon pusillum Z07020]
MKSIILTLITLIAFAVAVPFNEAANSLAKREAYHPTHEHDAQALEDRGVEAVAANGHGQGYP